MNQLIAFLIEHLMLDFDNGVSLDAIMRLLETDKSPLARDLRSRLANERDVGDLLVPMADCLRPFITGGINSDRIREQLQAWVEA